MVSPDADNHNDSAAAAGRRERRQRADAEDRSGSGSASTTRQRRAQRGSESGGRRRELDRLGPEQSTDGHDDSGLVICPKNVRGELEGVVGPELSAADALGLRFPSPELASSAAALFDRAAPWAVGRDRLGVEPESGRFRITVGPGVVRLGWTRPVGEEKAAERAVNRHRLDVAVEEDRIKAGRDVAEPPGRAITEWSRKSRAAMCRTFAELDYSPLVESGRIPAMITLTYPGDWEVVAPDGVSVKRHMVLWRKRFQREWGEPARYIWKLEFQRRGAPHIHLWMAPPQVTGRSGRTFRDWLSQAWVDIVSHPQPEQRARHLLAGTAVDVLNGLRACDPKRLAIYFTKHSSPNTEGGKEYQHLVPELWQQPGSGPGRFWGAYGLKKSVTVVEIVHDAYLAARRIVRRWSRSQAVYGDSARRFPTAVVPRTAIRLVPRADGDTGVVKHRRVRRRRTLCNHGGLAGGYALVNDGPNFAAQLARAVAFR
ncbi:rolling circle replication-associated protein [Mycolicibacter virginiensis]|uniref:rolling circle replication-associated protein n=1 Tax=Mycolicibacter virginiensis TaxID=1795032 RepID=UPI003D9BC0D8